MKPAKAEKAGWPRERLPAQVTVDRDRYFSETQTRMLPAIFAAGSKQRQGDWLSFDDDNLQACADGGCVVCGLPLGRRVLFGHTWKHSTNGPPAHPRCFALTLKFCPHFSDRTPYRRKRATVAYLYDGDNWHEAYRPVAMPQPDKLKADFIGTDYALHPRKVRACTRARCLDLAKTDPLGAGESAGAFVAPGGETE